MRRSIVGATDGDGGRGANGHIIVAAWGPECLEVAKDAAGARK